MGVSSQSHPVDESTLANDVVRLLGGENQRLRLELQEAERRARDAERRAEEAEARTAMRKEHTDTAPDSSAAHRIQQLQQESESLRARQQELESKYASEKEKRKSLKAELKELKGKGNPASSIIESSEYLELRKRYEQTRARLTDEEIKVKELSQQAEQLTSEKEMYTGLYEDASGRVSALTRNDPFGYIDEIHAQRQSVAFTRLRPFQIDGDKSRQTFEAFCNNTLKPRGLACLPFVCRKHDIHWSLRQQGYGVTVAPAYRYVTTRTQASYEWIPNEIRVIEGPFELFYETQNHWYYAGTYTTTGIQSRKRGFFEMLRPMFRDKLMKETVEKTDLLPPIIRKTVMEMYSSGVLHINCLVFERIGFNEQLNSALLEFGRDVKGPEYGFDYKSPKRKSQRETGDRASSAQKRLRKP